MEQNQEKHFSPLNTALMFFIIVLLVVIGVLIIKMRQPGFGPPPPEPLNSEMRTATGVVKGFQHNVHLDFNGLQLKKNGDGLLVFEFRPHTARSVMATALPGDSVEVTYNTRPNDEAIIYQLHRLKNLRKGLSVDLDALPPPPRIPPGQRVQTLTVEKPQIITDSYGGVAALQAKGKLFHFKPEQVEDIQPLIKNGRQFTLMAVKRGTDQGFVNINHDEVYIVISITIDNKTFIIR